MTDRIALRILINGQTRLHGAYMREQSPELANTIARNWDALCSHGRVTILAEGSDGVTHIVARDGMPADFGSGEV